MYVSVSGELITVYFECSEKKKGQTKRKEMYFSSASTLMSFVVPDYFVNGVLLCNIFHSLWHKCCMIQMISQREEHFPTFQLLRKRYQYTEGGPCNNVRPLNSNFLAEELQE